MKNLFVIIILFNSLLFAQTVMQTRTFVWSFQQRQYTLKLPLPVEQYDFYKNRSRYRDYDLFLTDNFDNELLKALTRKLVNLANARKVKKEFYPEFIVSFVESIPYSEDIDTKKKQEYPRYCFETLWDQTGDCEDKVILAGAILQELNYDIVILAFENHAALGINLPLHHGKYYEYKHKKYYYLETTGRNWGVGNSPADLNGKPPEIIPTQKRTMIWVDNAKSKFSFDDRYVIVSTEVKLTNLGTKDADDAVVRIMLQQPDTTKIWDQKLSDPLYIREEKSLIYRAEGLKVRSGRDFRVAVEVIGKNYKSNRLVDAWHNYFP